MSDDSLARSDALILFPGADGAPQLEVRLQSDFVWLSLDQMAALFARHKSVISKHLKAIFESGELERTATVARNATVRREGDRDVPRPIDLYNLDAILSVGYRVNSKRGTRFRIWATSVLRSHLLTGYSLAERRGSVTLRHGLTRFALAPTHISCTASRITVRSPSTCRRHRGEPLARDHSSSSGPRRKRRNHSRLSGIATTTYTAKAASPVLARQSSSG